MRCKKCGTFVTREVVEATEEVDQEYVAYVHLVETECICVDIFPYGSFDGTGSVLRNGKQIPKNLTLEERKKLQTRPTKLRKPEKELQMYAIDTAMQLYYADGIPEGGTWQDVQQHDNGGSCTCASCVSSCKICQKRQGILLGEQKT